MASLTEVGITARKAVRYTIFFLIFLIVGRVILGIGIGIFSKVFPKAPPPPTVAFGPLPALPFPEKKDLPKIEYKLETTTGDFPALSTQAKVYYMPKRAASLLSLEDAKSKAVALGFTSEPEAISETVYRFKRPDTPASMDLNIVTGVFSLSYNLNLDPTPIEKRPVSPQVATQTVKNFLSQGGLLPTDLSDTETHEFLKIEGKQLVPAISLSEANLIRINLFRKDYEKIPSVTPDPTKGNIWFLVSGDTSREKQIVGGEFHYFPVDENQTATYPLKTAQEAYEELKAGNGYVADLGLNTNGQVTIRKIYLAYFDPKTRTDFFQPVIVFEGDRGFVGYVPGVVSKYYNLQK